MLSYRCWRVRLAAPLLCVALHFCSILSGAHSFAFTNLNVVPLEVAGGERCLHRRLHAGASSIGTRSRGVSMPQASQGGAMVVMNVGTGSKWSWEQATATAVAVFQIAATGAPAMASVLEPPSARQSLFSTRITQVVSDADSVAAENSRGTAADGTVAEAASGKGTFEEAWSLSNQFYYDRTHKGNDWNTLKSRLSADIKAGKKSENAATKEMLALLNDKYTRLIGPEVYDMLSKYDLIGVGVMLSPNPAGQLVVASPPKANGQAEKLGVKKGDLVTSINGLNAVNMDSFEVTDYLAKYEGKTVTFELQSPEAGSEKRSVELERTFPSTENPVSYRVKDQGEHKVGYARLRDFNSIVAKKLKDALVEMKAEGADEFVLDLRGNGGGAFQSALGVAGLFMDTKPITYVVDGSGQRAEFFTKKEAVVAEDPLVVWVDGASASSSEVLAGALQDDCRAVLRGERTFGKGLVQAVYGLADGQGLILTVAQYETPRGEYIHGRGLTPDIRGGLPLKMVSTTFDFDQAQFDAARQKMKMCPPMGVSRLEYKGAAGSPSTSSSSL